MRKKHCEDNHCEWSHNGGTLEKFLILSHNIKSNLYSHSKFLIDDIQLATDGHIELVSIVDFVNEKGCCVTVRNRSCWFTRIFQNLELL